MRLERRVREKRPGYLDPEDMERCAAHGEARLVARTKFRERKTFLSEETLDRCVADALKDFGGKQ